LHIGSRGIPETELAWEGALRNLREVVTYGSEHGVTVCLENLKQGWTGNPEKLAALAATSGAGVTLDIGHARGCLARAQNRRGLKEYIAPYLHRIQNLHVYEIESPEGRHLEPTNLEALRPLLNDLLRQGITWWVIELKDNAAIMRTKRLLEREYRVGY
jgi:sugar phosphate isomerase/epimerase